MGGKKSKMKLHRLTVRKQWMIAWDTKAEVFCIKKRHSQKSSQRGIRFITMMAVISTIVVLAESVISVQMNKKEIHDSEKIMQPAGFNFDKVITLFDGKSIKLMNESNVRYGYIYGAPSKQEHAKATSADQNLLLRENKSVELKQYSKEAWRVERMQQDCGQPTGEYSGGGFLIFIVEIMVLSRQYYEINSGENCEQVVHKFDQQDVIYEIRLRKMIEFFEEILKWVVVINKQAVILNRVYQRKRIYKLKLEVDEQAGTRHSEDIFEFDIYYFQSVQKPGSRIVGDRA